MKNRRVGAREKRSENIDQIPDPLWTTSGHAPGHAPEAVPLQKRWGRDEREAILDYLHGDVPASEVKACCYYEYARTSQLFRKARSLFLLGIQADLTPEEEAWRTEVAREVVITADLGGLLRDFRGLEIVSCDGFPDKPWRALTDQQRQDICVHFVQSRMLPVITDSFILKSRGVLDRFKEQAEQEWLDYRKRTGRIPRGQYPSVVGGEDQPVKYVVLTLDYSHGEKALKEAVSQWIGNEANAEFFDRFYGKPIDKKNPDTPTRYKERLKFLAAWRLFCELDFKDAADWTRNNCLHEDYHVRPFFNERLRRIGGATHYGGPLFKELRQWKAAIERARSFLAREIDEAAG